MKKKILIVENEQTLCTVLTDKFIKENFDVLVAKDGQEGLNMALKTHPDCILLDILMPVMDGMSMLGELRKDVWGKNARVIMLTNLTSAEHEAGSQAHGVNEYLIKTDWTLDDVVKKVREKIGDSI
jgi:two-component system alkaline phosphatase synthesis response regulator PhoP